MPIYVDGFVLPVPKKNLAKYRAQARRAAKVWIEHGALEYRECVGDDMTPEGAQATFPKQMKAKPSETIVFAWIVYPSKAARARVLKKVMADPRLQMDMSDVPFDTTRMLYGGFKGIVDLKGGRS